MDRRAFLGRAGLLVGGGVAGAGVTGGLEERHIDVTVTASGHAVGLHRPPGLLTTSINYRVATDEPLIALTFDDGPSPKHTAAVLDILDRAGVTATFFLIGKHVQAFPHLARRTAERHEIGNHTWSHPNMGLHDARRATEQLRRGEEAITAATGRPPTLFRPPYGAFSGAVAMIATSMKYPITLWDLEFGQHRRDTVRANVDRVSSLAGPGSIVLGHDGGTLDGQTLVDSLPSVIDRLRDRGFGFTTVSKLLALPGSEAPAAPSH